MLLVLRIDWTKQLSCEVGHFVLSKKPTGIGTTNNLAQVKYFRNTQQAQTPLLLLPSDMFNQKPKSVYYFSLRRVALYSTLLYLLDLWSE